MSKKTFGLLALFFFCAAVVPVAGAEQDTGGTSALRPAIEWEKTYGTRMVDWGRCVQQTADGGYILSGACDRNVYTPWQGFVYLVKTDSMGEVEWEQQHGITPYENLGHSVQQTSDGGYIIAGYIGYTYHIDAYVLKTDSAGNLAWTTILGKFDDYDDSLSVQQTADDGFIIAGWAGSLGAGSTDAWLIKLDQEGNREWHKTYGGTELDGANCVQQTADGGFIIAGFTCSFDSGGNGDAWLIRTDANGNEIWSRSFGGDFLDEGKSVRQTLDGGYILTGSTSSFSSGVDTDVWLIKTDPDGYEIWSNRFGGTLWDQGKCVVQTADGGYFITGDYQDPVREDLELYMVKTDPDGNEEWNYIIDHDGESDSGSYGIQTADGGYLVTGETGEYNLARVDALLIKLQGTVEPTVAAALDCHPSAGTLPFTTLMTVELTNRNGEQVRRLAGRIDLMLAGGQHYGSWRAGWTNIEPLNSYYSSWGQIIPALGSAIGANSFQLFAEDVTPTPYNQPPYPPAGDTATANCTVTGTASSAGVIGACHRVRKQD